MKKYMPVIITVIVLVAIAVFAAAILKTSTRSTGKQGSAATQTREEAKKKQMVASMMREAQAAYDAKNYQKAIVTTQNILKSVDNTSQEAKNLLQISQIHAMAASAPAPVAPPAPQEVPASTAVPMTSEQTQ